MMRRCLVLATIFLLVQPCIMAEKDLQIVRIITYDILYFKGSGCRAQALGIRRKKSALFSRTHPI